MKKWLYIILLSYVWLTHAQTEHTTSIKTEFQAFTAYYLFNVGYTYHNLNYFEGGLNAYLVQPNDNLIDLGATVNLGYSEGRLIAIPEAQVGYHFNFRNTVFDPYSANFNASFWVIRTSISPWHVTPEVGISAVDLVDLTVGYGYAYNQHNHVDLDGLKLGLSIRLPFLLFWND